MLVFSFFSIHLIACFVFHLDLNCCGGFVLLLLLLLYFFSAVFMLSLFDFVCLVAHICAVLHRQLFKSLHIIFALRGGAFDDSRFLHTHTHIWTPTTTNSQVFLISLIENAFLLFHKRLKIQRKVLHVILMVYIIICVKDWCCKEMENFDVRFMWISVNFTNEVRKLNHNKQFTKWYLLSLTNSNRFLMCRYLTSKFAIKNMMMVIKFCAALNFFCLFNFYCMASCLSFFLSLSLCSRVFSNDRVCVCSQM